MGSVSGSSVIGDGGGGLVGVGEHGSSVIWGFLPIGDHFFDVVVVSIGHSNVLFWRSSYDSLLIHLVYSGCIEAIVGKSFSTSHGVGVTDTKVVQIFVPILGGFTL